MNVQELLESLEANSESSLRFVLPSGESIPDHFHITEVGRVEKTSLIVVEHADSPSLAYCRLGRPMMLIID